MRDLASLADEDDVLPECYALEPRLDWTEEHRDLVVAAQHAWLGRFLIDGGYVEISWPPRASMTSIGSPARSPDSAESTPAEWEWSVAVTTWEVDDESVRETEVERLDFMTTSMDPTEVEYSDWGPIR